MFIHKGWSPFFGLSLSLSRSLLVRAMSVCLSQKGKLLGTRIPLFMSSYVSVHSGAARRSTSVVHYFHVVMGLRRQVNAEH